MNPAQDPSGWLTPRRTLLGAEQDAELAYLLDHGQPGDPRLLDVLIERYTPELERFARLFADLSDIRLSQADLRQLLEQTFAEAILHLERFKGGASARAWLFGIAARRLRKVFVKGRIARIAAQPCRQQGRQQGRRLLPAARPRENPSPANLPATDSIVTGSAHHDELLSWLRELPQTLRLPLAFHYAFGLEGEELASILHIDRKRLIARLEAGRERMFPAGLDADEAVEQPVHVNIRKILRLWPLRMLDGFIDPWSGAGSDSSQAQVVKAHLADCTSCQAYAAGLKDAGQRLVAALLAGWPLQAIEPEEQAALLDAAQSLLKDSQARPMLLRLPATIRQIAWIGALGLAFILAAIYFIRQAPAESDVFARPTRTPTPLPTPVGDPPPTAPAPVAEIPEDYQLPYLALMPALSADGRWMAYLASSRLLTDDGTARPPARPPDNPQDPLATVLYDRQTGQTLRIDPLGTSPDGLGISFLFQAPDISADGRWVVFTDNAASDAVPGPACEGALPGGEPCLDVLLYDRESGTLQRITQGMDGGPANNSSFSARISGDGRWIAFWSSASNLVAGDDEPCDQQSPTQCTAGPTAGPTDIFFYERASGRIERLPVGMQLNLDYDLLPHYLRLSMDGRWLALDIYQEFQIAADLDVKQFVEAFVYDRVGGIFTRLAVTPEGEPSNKPSHSAGISADGRFAFFSSQAYDLTPGDAYESQDIFIRDLIDDSTAGPQELEQVRLSNPERPRPTETASMELMGFFGPIASLSADGRYLAFVSADPTLDPESSRACDASGDTDFTCVSLYLYDRESGETRLILDPLPDQAYLMAGISADAHYLTTTTFFQQCEDIDDVCADVLVYDREQRWHTAIVGSNIQDKTEKWLPVANLETQLGTGLINQMALSPDSHLVAVSSADQVELWEIEQNKVLRTLESGEAGMLLDLAFSPDGKWLAGGASTGSVLIWRTSDGHQLYELKGHPGRVHTVFFSKNGDALVSITDSSAWFWRIGDGRLLREVNLEYPKGFLVSAALSPSGNLFAAAGSDGTVWLQWLSGFEGQPPGKLVSRLGRHSTGLSSIQFSPAGDILATRSRDGLINLWRVVITGNASVAVEPLHSIWALDWLGPLEFTPDGNHLVSGSVRSGLQAWRVEDGRSDPVGNSLPAKPPDMVTGSAFSRDGQTLALTTGRFVEIWRISGKILEPNFFTRAEKDEFFLAENAADNPLNDEAPLLGADPSDSVFTSLYHAAVKITFDLLVPTRLPAGVYFEEARLTPYGGIALRYVVSDLRYSPAWPPENESGTPVAGLTIYQRPISEQALPVTIGASAEVQQMQIESINGEFVAGDWGITLHQGPQLDATTPRFLQWWWESSLPGMRVRFQHGNLIVGLVYRPYDPLIGIQSSEWSTDTTADSPPSGLMIYDLVQIAAGLRELDEIEENDPVVIDWTVSEGDTLSGIAEFFVASLNDLIIRNKLPDNGNLLIPGQVLQVPLPNNRRTLGIVDLDCDGRFERLQGIPVPRAVDSYSQIGFMLQTQQNTGLYQDQWMLLVDYSMGEFLAPPILLGPWVGTGLSGCERFLALRILGREVDNLLVYRWMDGEMRLLLQTTGWPLETLDASRLENTMQTIQLQRDAQTGLCDQTTITYTWDGEALVETQRSIENGIECP
jgi:WD40 repeat protein/DNA-directed RNA polymerase specialized sigma24 family protein